MPPPTEIPIFRQQFFVLLDTKMHKCLKVTGDCWPLQTFGPVQMFKKQVQENKPENGPHGL